MDRHRTVWLLEHSEVTTASLDFAWKHWTDVTHWDDPPARFVLEGAFETGTRGATLFPDRDPVRWVLRQVRGHSYTIESELDGARLLCEWSFESSPEGGTALRQRIGVSGTAAARHAEGVRLAFGSTLAEGMKRIARSLAEAETRARSAG